MSKNLIPKIAKMLGVELGEEFKVVSKDGNEQICNFTMAGLFEHDNKESGSYNKELLAEIVCNNAGIVKLQWKPKFADRYFGFFEFNGKLQICRYDIWRGSISEEAQYRCGWIFRTREEAEAALPAVAKEMGVEYEL